MPFTVSNALEIEIFRKCRLLTGQVGLQNEIHWVNILEILDDLSHIETGEFLITTAHGFDTGNKSKQLGMLELFSTRRLAAMAIQTGHYIKEIPPSFIRLSEEYNIPLIEIPPEVSFKKLTRALMNELVRHELNSADSNVLSKAQILLNSRLNEMNQLWLKLAESKNPEDLHTEMKHFNIKPREPFQVLLLQVNPGKTKQTEQFGEFNANLITSVKQTAARILLQRHTSFLIGPSDQHIALLIQSSQLKEEKTAPAKTLTEYLCEELKLLFPDYLTMIGSSNVHSNISAFKPALNEAGKALQAARLGLLDNTNLVSYNKLGLYRLIMEINNIETLQELYNETIAPLLEYDRRCKGALLQTMKVFLKNMRIKNAAEILFVHRHTMRYRLEQIKNLTGYNPLDPSDALQLNLGLHVFHYLKTLNLLNN